MNSLDFLNQLNKLQLSLMQTKEIADALHISTSLADKYLKVLSQKNLIKKLARGKWLLHNSALEPLQAAEFIVSPKESYISLHSALFFHGMISQIPQHIYSVTIDRSKTINTSIGTFSFHHCQPQFFTGYDYIKPFLKIATPEKALVDYFYFKPTKSRQFTHLPELEIPKKFSWKKANTYCQNIPSKRTMSLVLRMLSEVKNSCD